MTIEEWNVWCKEAGLPARLVDPKGDECITWEHNGVTKTLYWPQIGSNYPDFESAEWDW